MSSHLCSPYLCPPCNSSLWWIAGHYPVYSICEHGPTDLLVFKLKPLLEKYNVTAYICGHDHCAETLNDGSNVDYHVVGASHGCDSSTAHKHAVPKDSLKFHYGDGLGAFAAVTVVGFVFQFFPVWFCGIPSHVSVLRPPLFLTERAGLYLEALFRSG